MISGRAKILKLNVNDTISEFRLADWSALQLARVEQALNRWVACPVNEPVRSGLVNLNLAMRYAVLDGGKRLRPLLVLAACEAVNGSPQAALRAASSTPGAATSTPSPTAPTPAAPQPTAAAGEKRQDKTSSDKS